MLYRPPTNPQDRFSDFVKKVMDGAARGHTLQTLKVGRIVGYLLACRHPSSTYTLPSTRFPRPSYK